MNLIFSKNAARWIFGFSAVIVSVAEAVPQTVWFSIPTALSYRDTRWNCESKTMIGNDVFLTASLDDGKLLSATMKVGTASTPLREFVFTADELAAQKIDKDSDGKFWFAELVLSERLAREAYYFWTWLACGGVPRVRTVESAPLRFVFTVFPATTSQIMKSTEVTFQGLSGNARRYNGTLLIGQGPLNIPIPK